MGMYDQELARSIETGDSTGLDELVKGWTKGYIDSRGHPHKGYENNRTKKPTKEEKTEVEKRKQIKEERDKHRMEGPQTRPAFVSDPKDLVKMALDKCNGDADAAAKLVLERATAGFPYEKRREIIAKFAPYLYPDLSPEDAKDKAFRRARALRVIAKSLSELPPSGIDGFEGLLQSLLLSWGYPVP